MLQSAPKWLCALLRVPCFKDNTALSLKAYAAILEEGKKSRKNIKVIGLVSVMLKILTVFFF